MLSGWTKIGDKVEATGKWSILKVSPHRGLREPIPTVTPFDDPERAAKTYRERSEALRKGGIFLVNPEGIVAACMWVSS